LGGVEADADAGRKARAKSRRSNDARIGKVWRRERGRAMIVVSRMEVVGMSGRDTVM
jgi:hypothetical protein